MNNVIDIRFEGRYGSLSDFEWRNVPPFAVVTGVNGTGKSQLLEVIAKSYGAFPRDNVYARPLQEMNAQCHIDGASFASGEVFHSYGEWLPLGGVAVAEEQVKEAIRSIYDNRTMYDRFAGVTQHPILQAVADRLGVTVEDATELSREAFFEGLTPGLLWNHTMSALGPPMIGNLAFLFMSYLLFERDARAGGALEQEVRRRYGEPPWLLLNEILDTSGLAFRIDQPDPIGPTSLFYDNRLELRLRDTKRNEEVPFHGLSSGEKVIMSTVLWNYGAQTTARSFKLLLLDEPDAHLHPSLTRRFLEVIRKVFVEERGVRVIMTTHSPSTVALVPKESLFEMRKTERPPIRSAPSKERAVAVLTDGFVAVQEATQTVLVEGKDDPPFYQQVWDLLKERSIISAPGPLEPSPDLAFVHGQGKNTVELIVPQMRARGLTSFHGLIDKDVSNAPSDGIHVLERNGMENYLYDPLNVWCALHPRGEAPAVPDVDVPRGRAAFVRELPQAQLQKIADTVLDKVVRLLFDLDVGEKATEEIAFVNGKRLRYPRWFLERDDKEIKKRFVEAFGQHVLPPGKPKTLLESYATLNMVPQDLLELFKTIQASSRP